MNPRAHYTSSLPDFRINSYLSFLLGRQWWTFLSVVLYRDLFPRRHHSYRFHYSCLCWWWWLSDVTACEISAELFSGFWTKLLQGCVQLSGRVSIFWVTDIFFSFERRSWLSEQSLSKICFFFLGVGSQFSKTGKHFTLILKATCVTLAHCIFFFFSESHILKWLGSSGQRCHFRRTHWTRTQRPSTRPRCLPLDLPGP